MMDTCRGRRVYLAQLPFSTAKLTAPLRSLQFAIIIAAALSLSSNHARADETLDTQWKKCFAMAQEAEAKRAIPQALSLYEKALSLAEQFGKQDGRLSVTLHRFGTFCLYWGMLDRSVSLYKESIVVIEHMPSDQRLDLDLATEYSLLCQALDEQRKHEEAESCARKALALQESLLHPEDGALIETLNRLGNAVFAQQRHAEALVFFKRAAHIAQLEKSRNLGPMLLNIARIEVILDKFDEADADLQKAMALESRSDPKAFADGLQRVGRRNTEKRRWQQAERCLKEAHTLLASAGSLNTPTMADLLFDYGKLYRLQGQFLRAESLYRQAFAILKQPKEPAQIKLKGRIASDLVQTLEAQGKSKETAAFRKYIVSEPAKPPNAH
jgi:tetratricopeptide (TPR) repeat protein